jgi:hypothetical protein
MFAQEVIGLESGGRTNFENFGKQNDIWVSAMWPNMNNTIKGKVVDSPKSSRDESCESALARGSSMHQKCSNYALTNFLFGLCRSMWIIDPLVTCPSPHLGAPTHPSTLEMSRVREHMPTPHPFTVFTLYS